MHVWLDLLARELLFFALLTTLGLGPASFLPARFGNTVRLAIAPALGVCVGACLTVTLVYAFPSRDTWWVVILFAIGSLVLAGLRSGAVHRPGVRTVLQVSVIGLVVVGSFDFALAERHTVGPAGGYQVGDTSGYVSEIDGEAHTSLRDAERLHPPFADLSLGYWARYAQSYQQLDISALEANVNELLGLGSTETQSPFLIAVLLTGALGAFAAVRSFSGRPTWAAALAGSLFAGSLFTQLFMDGSQAALTGASLLAPITIVGYEALHRRQPSTLVLFALLAAGLLTVYPLFVPPVTLAGATAIIIIAVQRWRRERPSSRELRIAGIQIAGLLALAAAFSPIALARDLRYWTGVLNGSLSFATLPHYKLPANVLPGWVLQTRDFYHLINLEHAPADVLFMGGLVVVMLIAVIAFGLWRTRPALLTLAVATGAALLAYDTWAGRHCEYCVQRNLIPAGALAPVALGVGVAALASLPSLRGVILRGGAVAIIVLAIGSQAVSEHQRLANGSYLLDHEDRQALGTLASDAGPLELEGFSAGQQPPMEQALIYNLADERTHHNVSLPTLTDDRSALFYLGGTHPLGPSFRPGYRYVLTRLAGIATTRQVVSRFGPIVLERRVRDLDVTITAGVSVAPARVDPSGTVWVEGPMEFLVTGGRPGSQAWVSLSLRRTVPVTVASGAPPAAVRMRGDLLRICVRAVGAPPVRSAHVQLGFTPRPAPLPSESYAVPLPPRGVRLVGMSASTTPCTR
jgi:hypothetical protein